MIRNVFRRVTGRSWYGDVKLVSNFEIDDNRTAACDLIISAKIEQLNSDGRLSVKHYLCL